MTLDELLTLRRRKRRPREMVILATCKMPAVGNPLIEIRGDPGQLDLRSLIDLEVEVAHVGQAPARTVRLLESIMQHRPRYLGAWNVRTSQRVSVVLHGEPFIHDITGWA